MSGADTEGGTPPGDGLRELGDVLKAIAADFDRASTDDERRALGREQLSAIMQHLQRAGVPGEALRPVLAIVYALIDVDRGCRPPLLETPRKGGRPLLPSDELLQRGLAAAATALFMRADKDGRADQALDRTLRKVASRVEGWPAARRWVENARSQPLTEAVKDWLERARCGGPDPDWDALIYAAALEEAPDGMPPAEWAEWLLAKGVKLYR